MASLLELIAMRYSCRKYLSTPPSDEDLDAVLEACRLAPSACNRQPWEVIVVTSGSARAALAEAYPRNWFAEAPAMIVIASNRDNCWVRKDGRAYGDVDVAIAMDHMILTATERGLGTCWIGAFDAECAREALNLPDHLEPLLMTPLGKPADTATTKERHRLSSFVHTDRYGEPYSDKD